MYPDPRGVKIWSGGHRTAQIHRLHVIQTPQPLQNIGTNNISVGVHNDAPFRVGFVLQSLGNET